MTNVEDRVEHALHVLAEHIEPDLATARARLASRTTSTAPPAHRAHPPRFWATIAAATVAVVGVGSLLAIGSRPEQQPAAQTDPPDQSVADTIASTPPTSSPVESSPVEPPATVVDTPPDIPTPERLAVLDPQPGVAPIRSDPVLDWVHATSTSPPRRWFIRRSADGTPTGGVSVSESPSTEWATTFRDAPSAGIEGVEARVVVTPPNAQVGWMTEGGVTVVAGVGDVDVDETIAAALLAVPADALAEVVVPEGFEEVAVPTDEGTVRYVDTMLTIGFSTVRQGGVDAAATALMMVGRDGPVSRLPGDDAWLTTTFGGHPTAVVAIGTDGVATVVGLPGMDLDPLASNVAVVPADEVTIAGPEVTHGVPADATRTYGEIDRGRWVVYEYSTPHTSDCFSIDASWGGSGDCSPSGKTDCPIAEVFSGPNFPPGFEIFVPYQVDDLAVSLDGEPAEVTIEHAQGFTFAYGPAPSANARLAVTVNGQPAC